MTVPSNIIFPLHTEHMKSGRQEDLEAYFRELTFALQRMYEQIAQGVNGDIRADYLGGKSNWTPLLKGTVVEGTFTYTQQAGVVLRRGLAIDVWFDVTWSAAGAAAGDLYVELPYKVARSNSQPYVGVVQSSAVTYTGGTGIVINAIQDTYRGEFWNVGDAFTSDNQLVVGTGQLRGHISYLGVADEPA